MLPGWIGAQLAAAAAAFFTETCMLEQEQTARGSLGNASVTWSVVAADVPCRLTMPSARREASVIASDQEQLVQEYLLSVPAATALDVNQRVTISGVVYSIIRIDTALTDRVFRTASIVRRR